MPDEPRDTGRWPIGAPPGHAPEYVVFVAGSEAWMLWRDGKLEPLELSERPDATES